MVELIPRRVPVSTAWLTQTEENYNYYQKFYKNLSKKITTSPLASILKTGSFEKAGGRGEETRVICRDFAGKVKNVIFTLPSVRKARQHRRRTSSERL